jgi:spermidine synthase
MPEHQLKSQDDIWLLLAKNIYSLLNLSHFQGMLCANRIPLNIMIQRPGNIVHSDFFNDHLVEIVDNGDYRSLYFAGNVLQSRISLTLPNNLILFYTHYMMAALLVQPEPERVLLIGVGAGALVRFLHHHFPHCLLDAVDNSPQIIKMARGYFRMPHKPPITIHCCDGFEFLATGKHEDNYDLILVDAFDENGMSKTIYTGDFFRLCQESLRPGGVLSCNLWSGDPQELQAVKEELSEHSTSRIYIPVQQRGNIVGLAFDTPVPWQKIDRPEKELAILSQRYRFDMVTIVRIAKKNNMNLRQRVGSLFNSRGGNPER